MAVSGDSRWVSGTSPVAVAAYAAAGIAQSDQFETGVKAFSLSLNEAIVPSAFVLTPGVLLFRGTETVEEVGVAGGVEPGAFDLVVRAVGGLPFGALALRNRRRADTERTVERGTTEAT